MFGNHNDVFQIQFRERAPEKPKKPEFNLSDFIASIPWTPGPEGKRFHQLKIGVVAISKKDGTPHPGGYYQSGAKVYSSEKMARAALRCSHDPENYLYVPAIAEIPS